MIDIDIDVTVVDPTKPLVLGAAPPSTSEMSERDHYIYQLAQFEPGIWFPQTATLERIVDSEANQQQAQLPYRKITMQVHRAIFNIPIDEKDLRFSGQGRNTSQ